MLANGTETSETQEAANIVLTNPVGLDKFGAQANLAGKLQHRLPQMIVVDDDDQRFGGAMLADAFEGVEDVHGVENVVENDVVELFVELEIFGITLQEMQIGMLGGGVIDHHLADLDANSKFRHDGSEKMAGFAAHVKDALARFDDKLQDALETVVKVFVGANPLVALRGVGVLKLAARTAKFVESLRSPVLACARFLLGGDHGVLPSE